ncbi:MAG: tRNA epoxyqueuosine(34) reductase QueG [Pseudomonadota bacterium]
MLQDIKRWGQELGFAQISVSDIQLDESEKRLGEWLSRGFHGSMDYMRKHGRRRTRPAELVDNTISVITARMDYLPESMSDSLRVLQSCDSAYISRYALGRDYHKVMRKRLQKLAHKITAEVGEFGYRAFCDSAPVMEKPLAVKSGQGWMGKSTNILNRHHGSWFFLGELYTNLPLPSDEPVSAHCGSCSACMDKCPTGAIVAPYTLDARRCISYLTIESHDPIPEKFRHAIGNRIYGCDDCQLVCPWNRFAEITAEPDFHSRHGLTDARLVDLFSWSEDDFFRYTEGSAIRRIGYHKWLRNIAVALGNASTSNATVNALRARLDFPSDLVREHVVWALQQHQHI